MSNKKDLIALDAIKADRIKVGKGLPSKREGQNGDITVRQVPSGLCMYTKLFDKWYKVGKLEDITRDGGKYIGTPEDKTFGKIEVQNQLKFNKGTKTVTLKMSDDGETLKVRNLNDTADGDIQVANIKDVNGNKLLEVNPISGTMTSHIKMTNSITTGHPTIEAASTDASESIVIKSKGSGHIYLHPPHADGNVGILDNAGNVKITLDPDDLGITEHGTNSCVNIINTNGHVLQIGSYDVLSGQTDSHIKISASDDLYLAAGGSDIWLHAGGTGQNGASFDMGDLFGNLGAGGGSYILHDSSNSSTGYLIDSNLSGTGASSGTGLQVDFDRTDPGSGTAAHTDKGINLDVNSSSKGTSTVQGMDIDVVGAGTGTQTATGIDLNVSGGDTNIGLKITAPSKHIHLSNSTDPSNDYGTIAVADTGDMTISTTGDGTTDSDLTLDIDGDLYVDVDGGEARITDGGGTYTPSHATSIATKAYVDGKRFAMTTNGQAARMSVVNTWYISNQSFGTGIGAADWATTKFNYSLYNSNSAVKLKSWRVVGEVSSSVDYEWELWDITIPADGTAAIATAAKVGDTQSVSPTAYRIYTIGQTDLGYAVADAHALYLLRRYTSGSGTKYSYESATLEFEVA